jgi:hypothetical protein
MFGPPRPLGSLGRATHCRIRFWQGCSLCLKNPDDGRGKRNNSDLRPSGRKGKNSLARPNYLLCRRQRTPTPIRLRRRSRPKTTLCRRIKILLPNRSKAYSIGGGAYHVGGRYEPCAESRLLADPMPERTLPQKRSRRALAVATDRFISSGSLAIFAAMRRASSI